MLIFLVAAVTGTVLVIALLVYLIWLVRVTLAAMATNKGNAPNTAVRGVPCLLLAAFWPCASSW